MPAMKRRAVILTEIIAPYRNPVFNALAARDDVDPHIIFLSETDPGLRQWRVYKDEIKFSYQVLPARRHRFGKFNLLLNTGAAAALRRALPEAVVCGGYNFLAYWQAGLWANRNRIPLLLWSESNSADMRTEYPPVEFLKKRFIQMCSGFIAAGKASRDYLLQLGAPEGTVLIAPDSVDVNMYTQAAATARTRSRELRTEHALPERYFLYVGRMVREKGVFDLLAAYAKLDMNTRLQIGLVFVGDGPVRAELERRASRVQTGTVKFCGWVHREQISQFYALAHALVFPTHSDPWGLVVNEAMACGLPIIASHVAGCVENLVIEPENGFTFPPGDVDSLVKD